MSNCSGRMWEYDFPRTRVLYINLTGARSTTGFWARHGETGKLGGGETREWGSALPAFRPLR